MSGRSLNNLELAWLPHSIASSILTDKDYTVFLKESIFHELGCLPVWWDYAMLLLFFSGILISVAIKNPYSITLMVTGSFLSWVQITIFLSTLEHISSIFKSRPRVISISLVLNCMPQFPIRSKGGKGKGFMGKSRSCWIWVLPR